LVPTFAVETITRGTNHGLQHNRRYNIKLIRLQLLLLDQDLLSDATFVTLPNIKQANVPILAQQKRTSSNCMMNIELHAPILQGQLFERQTEMVGTIADRRRPLFNL
jgi:hypothetical protein